MEIENVLNKEFVHICDWFVDNKLKKYFGEDETKLMIFRLSRENLPELN